MFKTVWFKRKALLDDRRFWKKRLITMQFLSKEKSENGCGTLFNRKPKWNKKMISKNVGRLDDILVKKSKEVENCRGRRFRRNMLITMLFLSKEKGENGWGILFHRKSKWNKKMTSKKVSRLDDILEKKSISRCLKLYRQNVL